MTPPRSDLNDAGVEFVLRDLDVALTFMDLADTSQVRDTVIRNRENARHAYDSVLALLWNLQSDALQKQEIDEKLALLKARLKAIEPQL